MLGLADIIEILDQIAPPWLADDGDPIGLQVGDRTREVRRICTAVDPSPAVVDAALERRADLLVTHHPLIYNPLKTLAAGDPIADRVSELIRANLALYVMHTNYDTVPGGVNDVLAEMIGVVDTSPLTTRRQDRYHKIVVFVPEEAVERVRDAMAGAGAGRIGLYTHCSFRARGVGSFMPEAEAKPYIGTPGKLEEVDEWRLEMVCVGSGLDAVISAMKEAHPYEEVAYDVYEIANEPVKLGYGRVGDLRRGVNLSEFADQVRNTLDVRFPKMVGDPRRPIRRVALCSGGGASLFREAASSGADVYVTGDWRHHDILSAADLGLAVVDAGHFESEKPAMVALAERLADDLRRQSVEIGYIE